MKKENENVCPLEKAGSLDNWIRKLLQNPQKILKPYIHRGMKVLDLGCGPGFFTIEIAKLLGDSGTVFAADLQEGMLEKVKQKISRTKFEPRISLHKCDKEYIGLNEKVDLVLAFYVIHELPNKEKIFRELKSMLKPDGAILVIEPKFHVSKKVFESTIDKVKVLNLEIYNRPSVFFSRSVLLKNIK